MPTSSAPREHLKLEGIGVSFGAVNVIPSLDLSVRKGEMVAFLGPSGCGKTTTLRIIAGLNNPSRGRIMVEGAISRAFPSTTEIWAWSSRATRSSRT